MNCALIFCVGLAALLDLARRRPLMAPLTLGGALIVVNVFFMVDLQFTNLQQSGAVTFDRIIRSTSSRLGNPFSLPMNLWIGWKYGSDLTLYERLGSQTFNNARIEFGEERDDRFLAFGWSGRERNPNFSYRWAVGRAASIVVPLRQSDDYRLEFRGGPFVYPGAGPQVVEVWVNQVLVERLTLLNGIESYRVPIARAFIDRGLNEFRFRFAYAASPFSQGLSTDQRELSVLFDGLDLLRGAGAP